MQRSIAGQCGGGSAGCRAVRLAATESRPRGGAEARGRPAPNGRALDAGGRRRLPRAEHGPSWRRAEAAIASRAPRTTAQLPAGHDSGPDDGGGGPELRSVGDTGTQLPPATRPAQAGGGTRRRRGPTTPAPHRLQCAAVGGGRPEGGA